MVQQQTGFSNEHIAQQISQTLGQDISDSELSKCLKQIQFLEPAAGKPFWQAADATAGIYIILAGKVRLLDSNDNLIASREASDSFGELTLFSDESFQPYAARASVKLKLCYLGGECLQALIRKHPNIQDHLYRQAILWDLLVLCRQATPLGDSPPGELIKALSLLFQHNLESGRLPAHLLKDQRLWLLRRGELLHSSGRRLTTGSIYTLSQSSDARAWQVAQPTELYSLSHSDWETALDHLPRLVELISSDAGTAVEGEQRSRSGEESARPRSKGAGEKPESKIQLPFTPHPPPEFGGVRGGGREAKSKIPRACC